MAARSGGPDVALDLDISVRVKTLGPWKWERTRKRKHRIDSNDWIPVMHDSLLEGLRVWYYSIVQMPASRSEVVGLNVGCIGLQ